MFCWKMDIVVVSSNERIYYMYIISDESSCVVIDAGDLVNAA